MQKSDNLTIRENALNFVFANAFNNKLTTNFLMRFPQILTIDITVTLIPLSITSTSNAQAHTKGLKVAPLTSALKPGDYVSDPDLANLAEKNVDGNAVEEPHENGLAQKSATKPSRSKPAKMQKIPVKIASTTESDISEFAWTAVSDIKVVPIMAQVAATGLTIRCRIVPKIASTSNGRTAAYKPTTSSKPTP